MAQEKRPFDCPYPQWTSIGGSFDIKLEIEGLKMILPNDSLLTLDAPMYNRDTSVYYMALKLRDIPTYYKNDTAVYYNFIRDVGGARAVIVQSLHKLEGADPKSFKKIGDTPYSYDNKHVYFNGFLISGADPKSFQPLTPYYSKDNNRVYFRNCEMKDIDTLSFKTVDNGGYYDFAYDDNYLYFYGERVKIDKNTFTFEKEGCVNCFHNSCRDKNNIYYLHGTSFDGYITKKRNVKDEW